MKLLSFPSHFTISKKKRAIYIGIVRHFVAAATTVYQLPNFWRTEGEELFVFLFDPNIFWIWIYCNAWSNLTEEIQFLEFMGRSNLTYAHSNYLLCMHFIRKNTVQTNCLSILKYTVLLCLCDYWCLPNRGKFHLQILEPLTPMQNFAIWTNGQCLLIAYHITYWWLKLPDCPL